MLGLRVFCFFVFTVHLVLNVYFLAAFFRCHKSSGRGLRRVPESTSPARNRQNCKQCSLKSFMCILCRVLGMIILIVLIKEGTICFGVRKSSLPSLHAGGFSSEMKGRYCCRMKRLTLCSIELYVIVCLIRDTVKDLYRV